MSEENSEITNVVLGIKNSCVEMAHEYSRKELHCSDEEFMRFYADLKVSYMKGVDTCDMFFEHYDIDVFVADIIKLGFFYQAAKLSKFVKSDVIKKAISDIKQEFGYTDKDFEDSEDTEC